MKFELTKETFVQMVYERQEPVLVDFSAAWCGPCKMLEPVLEELAEQYPVGTVDVDAQPELAQMFQISAVPTLMWFRGKKCIGMTRGYQSRAEIEKLLQKED